MDDTQPGLAAQGSAVSDAAGAYSEAAAAAAPALVAAAVARVPAAGADARAAPAEADEDAALLRAFAAGDAAAFARLYERHERPLYRFLRRSLTDDATADELAQETWMTVLRHAARWEPRARFATWLFGVARTRLVDHWRARRPALSLDEPAANDPDGAAPIEHLVAADGWQPEVRALTRAQGAALLRAVEALPPAQREAFLLHVEGGLTLAEIGALTGVGMETAKSRLRYALARLRAALAAWQ